MKPEIRLQWMMHISAEDEEARTSGETGRKGSPLLAEVVNVLFELALLVGCSIFVDDALCRETIEVALDVVEQVFGGVFVL